VSTARDAYSEGVGLLLGAKPGPERAFQRAIDADAEFALAHAGLARALFLAARIPEAKTAAAKARALAPKLPQRERAVAEIVLLTIEGGSAKAYTLAREHLKQYPTDAMVLGPCTGVFGLIGFSGRTGREQELRELMEGLAPHYGDEAWFLVQLAFSQVETGDTEIARTTIERAMQLDPQSAHGAHVKAHVHYEANEKEQGLKLLQEWIRGYAKEGLLHCHINWHIALWQLELGNPEEAMRTYLQGVHPGAAWGPPINVLSDSAAFLWRAGLAGHRRDQRLWQEVSAYGSRNFPAAGLVFADVHRALAYAASADAPALENMLHELHDREEAGKLFAGAIVPHLAEAFDAFARKDYAKAVALIEPHMSEHERIGGSRAQRRLIELTLDAARAVN
jgi:Tfp pilus assembly protein PilF